MQWSWAVYWTWAVVQIWSMESWLIRPQVSGMHAKLKHIKQCWSSSSSSYIAYQIIQIPLPRQDSLFDDFFHLKLTNCIHPGPNFASESLHNLLLLPSLQSPCIPLCPGRKTSIRRALHSNALSLILHHACHLAAVHAYQSNGTFRPLWTFKLKDDCVVGNLSMVRLCNRHFLWLLDLPATRVTSANNKALK